MKRRRIPLMGFILLSLLFISIPVFAYTIDAEMIEPNGMIFPVGGFIPGDLSNADDIDFQSIAPIFEMNIRDTDEDDPDSLVVMVRLQVAGGEPIFTATSSPVNIRRVLVPLGWINNVQLANTPGLDLGQTDEITAENIMPFIDGGNLADNLYVLTVILADPSFTSADWNTALNNNYGIISTSSRIRNPSQVELVQPEEDEEIWGNPIFAWSFPRNPGVRFRLLVVSGDPDDNPGTVLDFANESNTYLDSTFEAGLAGGELTTYAYAGIENERPLDQGRTYFWKVIAMPLTMFGESAFIESIPRKFSYGALPDIELSYPDNGGEFENQGIWFGWNYPQGYDIEFQIRIVRGDMLSGAVYGDFPIRSSAGGELWGFNYGQLMRSDGGAWIIRDLDPGSYQWQITGSATIDGEEFTVESEIREFKLEPTFSLASPTDISTWSTRRQPRFSWSAPFQPSRFIATINQDFVYFEGQGGASDQTWTYTVDGDVTNLERTDASSMVGVPGEYSWYVTAVFETAQGNYDVKTETARFTVGRPLLRLDEPVESDYRQDNDEYVPAANVYTGNPMFTWHWSDDPGEAQPPGEFEITLTSADFSTEIATGSVTNQGEWTYSGEPLEINTEYGVVLESKGEPGRDRIRGRFTYASDPVIREVRLRRPQDNAVFEGFRPRFRWGFPQLGAEFDLTFELTITPLDAENADEIVIPIDDYSARSVRVRANELVPGVTYEWRVKATYTPPQGQTYEVNSDTRSFLYNPPPWRPGSPQARLINNLRGNVPPEMLTLIIDVLRNGYVNIGGIRLDGSEANISEIIQLLRQDNIELVLLNISR